MKMRSALYHAVHDYPGGVGALAAHMGLAESTLQNMANPRTDTHDWNLKRIQQVRDFTGDLRIAHAFAEESGGVFMPAGAQLATLDDDIFRLATSMAKEFGDVVAEVQTAMADGRMSQSERERIHQQIYELTRAAFSVGQRVDQLVQPPSTTLSVVPKVR